jgi:hypothetical protein
MRGGLAVGEHMYLINLVVRTEITVIVSLLGFGT